MHTTMWWRASVFSTATRCEPIRAGSPIEAMALLASSSSAVLNAGSLHAFAITCGSEGCLVWDGTALTRVPSPAVKAVDTLGAGDLFAGAYLFSRCRDEDHVSAARFANRCAARLVTHFGPRLPAAVLQELLAN